MPKVQMITCFFFVVVAAFFFSLSLLVNLVVQSLLSKVFSSIDSSCMTNITFSATQNGRLCLHTWDQLYFEYSKVTVSWLSLLEIMHLFHCQPLTVCEQLT